MPCGAILTFDQEVDSAVRGMWQVIEDAGLPSVFLEQNVPPHLTLMACEEMDLDGLIQHGLPQFLADFPPLMVDFSGLGIFTAPQPVIYLGATRSPALSALHAAYWALAESFFINPHPLYRPEVWVPHVTLNLVSDPLQTGSMLQALIGAPHPVKGLLTYLQIVDLDDGVTSMFTGKLGSLDSQ